MTNLVKGQHSGGDHAIYLGAALAKENISSLLAVARRSDGYYMADSADVPCGVNEGDDIASGATPELLMARHPGREFTAKYSGAAAADFCVANAGIWGPNGSTGATTDVVQATGIKAYAYMLEILDSTNALAKFVWL
jgi:hypothetical protein